MKKHQVIIMGAGGFGYELYQLLLDSKRYTVVGFVDAKEKQEDGKLWLGGDKDLKKIKSKCDQAFIAIGDTQRKEKVYSLLKREGFNLPVFVHPSAHVAQTVQMDEGTIVYPHVTLHHNVRIGKCGLINSNASVGHDTCFGDFVTLGPNTAIAGRITVANRVYVGIGAAMNENLNITDDVVIGAGSVVVSSIQEKGVYVGVPSKRMS
jgi:sugar O-acyltransferase (sialic acid O-acetyltransferase NeuD family)